MNTHPFSAGAHLESHLEGALKEPQLDRRSSARREECKRQLCGGEAQLGNAAALFGSVWSAQKGR